jgi:molybdate transport system ATP-binding protein
MLGADVERTRGDFSLSAALEVGAGESVALAGPSGAGKSTLLRLLAGLARPDRGSITMGEEVWLDSATQRSLEPEKRGVGFVFQDYALFPRMPAWRNVAYGIAASRGERRRIANESLERFGLSRRADARPADLSGGERQRVALARALACGPKLLLLDEPLSALDSRTRASSSRELARVLAEAEVPAIIVTHDFGEAALLADRVIVMEGGRIVQEGSAADLAARPASGLVADLTGAVVLRGTATPAPGGLTAVALDGGGIVTSTDDVRGPVAASVFPWEIEIGPADDHAEGSALNRLEGEVVSVTEFGNRARVGLSVPQPVAAEVTSASIARLGLVPGSRVALGWKATATRLTPL